MGKALIAIVWLVIGLAVGGIGGLVRVGGLVRGAPVVGPRSTLAVGRRLADGVRLLVRRGTGLVRHILIHLTA